ncbi:hypothetical protein M426DRAFT_100429 [Hypoxylon sp. CI-4A]|nr:hypothetical protein M426DRAFT_100429 [Hypoxylon sp. CI-4A]
MFISLYIPFDESAWNVPCKSAYARTENPNPSGSLGMQGYSAIVPIILLFGFALLLLHVGDFDGMFADLSLNTRLGLLAGRDGCYQPNSQSEIS